MERQRKHRQSANEGHYYLTDEYYQQKQQESTNVTAQMPLGVGKRRRVCNKLSEECDSHVCVYVCVLSK